MARCPALPGARASEATAANRYAAAASLLSSLALLKHVDAIHVEVAFFHYSGQEHGVTEIVPILSAAGLHLGPYQQCIGRHVSRYPYELDMLFVRQESLPRLLGY